MNYDILVLETCYNILKYIPLTYYTFNIICGFYCKYSDQSR